MSLVSLRCTRLIKGFSLGDLAFQRLKLLRNVEVLLVLSFIASCLRACLAFLIVGLVLITTDLEIVILIEVIVVDPRDLCLVFCKCLML